MNLRSLLISQRSLVLFLLDPRFWYWLLLQHWHSTDAILSLSLILTNLDIAKPPASFSKIFLSSLMSLLILATVELNLSKDILTNSSFISLRNDSSTYLIQPNLKAFLSLYFLTGLSFETMSKISFFYLFIYLFFWFQIKL